MAYVRMVSTEDVGALARVLKSVGWLPAAKQPLERLEKAMRRFLETVEATPASTVLVAEQEGEVVGFIAFHLPPSVLAAYEGCVSHLFIHAGARGQGIGRSRPAYQRQFYEKAGWQERDDAALFVRDLTGVDRDGE